MTMSALQAECSLFVTRCHGLTLDAEETVLGVPVVLVNLAAAVGSGALLLLPAILHLVHYDVLAPTTLLLSSGLRLEDLFRVYTYYSPNRPYNEPYILDPVYLHRRTRLSDRPRHGLLGAGNLISIQGLYTGPAYIGWIRFEGFQRSRGQGLS